MGAALRKTRTVTIKRKKENADRRVRLACLPGSGLLLLFLPTMVEFAGEFSESA